MTLPEIIKGSQLICEYMADKTVGERIEKSNGMGGSVIVSSKDYYLLDHPTVSLVKKDCLFANFHKDWNWIMPVARKAYEKIRFHSTIDRTIMMYALKDFDIEKVFEVTVSYIEFINAHEV